jgi:hypothetical protein
VTGWPRQWARPSSPARTPAWNPLGGGLDPIDTTRLEKIAVRHGATVQQVALAALLAASPVMLPIPAPAASPGNGMDAEVPAGGAAR